MNLLIGFLLIGMGSIGHVSSYRVLKKVTVWSWECTWFTHILFSLLIFPFLAALLAIPNGHTLLELFSVPNEVIFGTILLGVGWGLGGLIFGLSLRYVGESFGHSVALGVCSTFATILPAAIMGADLFTGKGLILLLAVSIGISGIFILSFAYQLHEKQVAKKKEFILDYSYGEGLFVAILSGLMSACFGLGLVVAEPIRLHAIHLGTQPLYAGLASIVLITVGGFIVNAFFSIYQNIAHKTTKDYFNVPAATFMKNISFSAISGALWFLQFFGLMMGKSFFSDGSVVEAFSWSILMALNISFLTIFTIFKEKWLAVGIKPFLMVVVGLLVIFSSLFIVVRFN